VKSPPMKPSSGVQTESARLMLEHFDRSCCCNGILLLKVTASRRVRAKRELNVYVSLLRRWHQRGPLCVTTMVVSDLF
jgi:hypothetical protein